MNPKVSIIIPVYNGSNYLKEAIDSAVAQTYKNIEIIVVNDGSNDNGATEKIAKSYGKKIRYFKKNNGGVATALNLGIEKMTGEYFSWLSHDDMYYPEKIEKQIGFFDSNYEKTIIISDWTLINENGKKIRRCKLDDKLELYPMCFLAFDTKTWLNACAMLIPVDLIKTCGLFNTALKTTQDYDMHFKFILSGVNFKIIHDPLLYSRVHQKQGSRIDLTATENADRIHKKIIEEIKSENLLSYFNDRTDIIEKYNDLMGIGYKRSAIHLIVSITKSYLKIGKNTEASNIVNALMIGEYNKKPVVDFSDYLYTTNLLTSKKRIMFCSGHWLTGGMERVMSILFEQLKNDYEIFLITAYDGRESHIELPKYVTHFMVSNEIFFGNLDVSSMFFASFFEIKCVIGFMNMFAKQLDFYKLCEGTDIKTIASSHEHYLYPYKSVDFYGSVKKRLDVLNKVDAALWPTNCSVAIYNQYNGNGYVMPNPNTYDAKKSPSSNPKENNIICVGRFNDYIKRVDRILECFSLVLKKVPDAKLTLVGKGDRDAKFIPESDITINSLIKDLNIPESNVIFVGETDMVDEYYKQASLLLLTSNNEGFGMVINEAACFGVPTVCNAIPGIEDLVIDGENGYIVEQDDISTMSEKVCDILNDKNLRNKLGKNAKDIVKKFDAKVIGEKWKLLIDSVINSNSPEKLNEKISKELSYEITDHVAFSKMLAKELNEVFKYTTSNTREVLPLSLLSKIKSVPKRLVGSIQYEGLGNTMTKIVKKIYKKAFRIK